MFRLLIPMVLALTLLIFPGHSWSPVVDADTTFVVNSSSDGNDGTCSLAPFGCTLREAIIAANSSSDVSTIEFNIPGTAPHTITLASALPMVAWETHIDARTQPGYSMAPFSTPLVALDGFSAAVSECLVLDLAADNSTIRGLAIMRCGTGILVAADSTTIEKNFIGTDPAGLTDMGNGVGVSLLLADDNVVRHNLVSGNDTYGVTITDAGVSDVNENRIGTNRYGLKAIPNGVGVRASGTSTLNLNHIRWNVISGNTGVAIQLDAAHFHVKGNLIGTDYTGTRMLANGGGVAVLGQSNFIGAVNYLGPLPICEDCNVIAGGGLNVSASFNHVQGNRIGTDKTGTLPFGSPAEGVFIAGTANEVWGNIVAFNLGDGIRVASGVNNDLHSNRLHSNNGLGIDLDPNGVNANDAGDGDTGPNNGLNYPVITSVVQGAGSITVSGTIDVQPGSYQMEVSASPSCDASGHGEGMKVIALFNSVIPSFNLTAVDPIVFSGGTAITATLIRNETGVQHSTSESSACFVMPSCPSDTDCDGFANVIATLHSGPFNTNTTVDNCVSIWNDLQLNTDGNFIELGPAKAFDDTSLPRSDAFGNECDLDDDADGISDGAELSGSSCGGIITNSRYADSDGDNFIDSAECMFLTDPLSPTSKPAETSCGPTGDSDGDRLPTRREVCYYGTSPSVVNTDGDTCNDGREVASVNASNTVDVLDLQQIAAEAGTYTLPALPHQANFDITRNGSIDVIDLQQAASLVGSCP